MNFDITGNFVKEKLLHNFIKYFSGPCANQLVNKDLNDASSCLSNLSFSASKKVMFTKLLLNKKMENAGHCQ